MANLRQFNLPDVGEGLIEADIVKWHVQPGDAVEVNQTIVEIETAKAVVELPCPYEGTVTELHVTEGQTVDVGVPIITVDVAGDVAEATEPGADPGTRAAGTAEDKAEDAEGKEAPTRQPHLVGYGAKPGGTRRRPRKPAGTQPDTGWSEPGLAVSATAAPEPTTPRRSTPRPAQAEPAAAGPAAPAEDPAAPAAPATGPVATTPAAGGRVTVLAKPPVRKLAKDLGIDLTTVAGTGPQGSITRDDVQAAVSAAAAPAQAPPARPAAPGVREERIPIKGVRKNTAAATVHMAFTAPHVTEWLQVDVTRTMEAVRRLREMPEFAGVKVSPLLLVAKAFLLAAARHPMINSAWDEDAQEIVVKHYVNLGIAAATERGLLVPNIKDAQDLALPDLARALAALTETARAGKTSLADMSHGTITITNVGVFGVDAGTPILPTGQSAILGFGQVRDMPWVHEGELAIRKVCTLSLSFDHRLIDGELGSAVLAGVGAMLEDPLRMIAWG